MTDEEVLARIETAYSRMMEWVEGWTRSEGGVGMTEELKGCPFCGSDWLTIHASRGGWLHEENWIECGGCGCRMVHDTHGCTDTPLGMAIDSLVRSWNRRAEKEEME